jgi:ribosomal protein S18 acetylase RimI-like enzyme
VTRFEIRDVDFSDPIHAQAIVDLIDAYASDPVGGGQPLPAQVRSRLVPGLQAHPSARVWLAFDDEVPIGIVVCFFGFSTFRARPLLNVHDLAVLPAMRGKGAGRALLREAERHAREGGCCKLTLEVQEDNARARGLYESFGFSDFQIGDSGPTRFLSKPILAP